MRWNWLLVCLCLLSSFGCSSPSKPSEADVAQARESNEVTRDIDKAHAVANEQSAREDDAALH